MYVYAYHSFNNNSDVFSIWRLHSHIGAPTVQLSSPTAMLQVVPTRLAKLSGMSWDMTANKVLVVMISIVELPQLLTCSPYGTLHSVVASPRMGCCHQSITKEGHSVIVTSNKVPWNCASQDKRAITDNSKWVGIIRNMQVTLSYCHIRNSSWVAAADTLRMQYSMFGISRVFSSFSN